MSVSSVCTKGGGGLGQAIDTILYHIPEILHKRFFHVELLMIYSAYLRYNGLHLEIQMLHVKDVLSR